jgi:hypothetical protein
LAQTYAGQPFRTEYRRLLFMAVSENALLGGVFLEATSDYGSVSRAYRIHK